MVANMDLKQEEKKSLSQYSSQRSAVRDVGDEGFGFGEDCFAGECASRGCKDRVNFKNIIEIQRFWNSDIESGIIDTENFNAFFRSSKMKKK